MNEAATNWSAFRRARRRTSPNEAAAKRAVKLCHAFMRHGRWRAAQRTVSFAQHLLKLEAHELKQRNQALFAENIAALREALRKERRY
jgi:hypothetical protein